MSKEKRIKIEGVYMCQDIQMDFGSPNIIGLIAPTLIANNLPQQYLNVYVFGKIFSSYKDKKTVEITVIDEEKTKLINPTNLIIHNSNNTYAMFISRLQGVLSFNKIGKYYLVFKDKETGEIYTSFDYDIVGEQQIKREGLPKTFTLPTGLHIPNDPKFLSHLKKEVDKFYSE